MTSILDSMMTKPRSFSPQNVSEYIALQLARKLGDPENAAIYVTLLDRYSMPVILAALESAAAADFSAGKIVEMFERSLSELTDSEDGNEL
jgi:hypothetical protein